MALSLCIGLFLFSSSPLASVSLNDASDVIPGRGTLSRPGDGSPVAGLGKEFHSGRRAELRKRLGDGWAFFRGLDKERDAEAFRQDKQFWYLTGVESPNAALLMNAKTGQEILFLPAQDAYAETWEGELWDAGDEWVRSLTGFGDVRPAEGMVDTLKELVSEGDIMWTSSHPTLAMMGTSDYAAKHDKARVADELDGRINRAATLSVKLKELLGVEIKDCVQDLLELRWAKTEEEIEAMRRSSYAGALSMSEAIRSTRPGLGEWELQGLMSWVHMNEGADGPAYYAIVGSGANSCILHYSDNKKRMADGEVVLIDYGCEVDHYTTDITRTWPVNGKFSERAAELYDAVLEAQVAAIAAVKPGVTMRDVSKVATDLLKAKGYGDLIKHGTCHWIGMEVHDPGPTRDGVSSSSLPLVPGVAFTVEPGLYEASTGIGIRIEDVVVVTEDGCEVITGDVPKARAEVEALVQSEGVLDRLRKEK
ncbi:MAG: Xaa-Pro aminopeptidase [Planctomycetota bacterium]|jgi:Xaa-Pro aminopeptidase